jgi:hypothetical protein
MSLLFGAAKLETFPEITKRIEKKNEIFDKYG